jgi:hypothetical protein
MFENYFSSSIYYKQFSPTQYSKTLFLFDFRSPDWAGVGISFDYEIFDNLDIHFYPSVFIPEEHHFVYDRNEVTSKPLTYYNIISEVGIIYHTRFGPVSVSLNILDKKLNNTSILVNFGYILFNKH